MKKIKTNYSGPSCCKTYSNSPESDKLLPSNLIGLSNYQTKWPLWSKTKMWCPGINSKQTPAIVIFLASPIIIGTSIWAHSWHISSQGGTSVHARPMLSAPGGWHMTNRQFHCLVHWFCFNQIEVKQIDLLAKSRDRDLSEWNFTYKNQIGVSPKPYH